MLTSSGKKRKPAMQVYCKKNKNRNEINPLKNHEDILFILVVFILFYFVVVNVCGWPASAN